MGLIKPIDVANVKDREYDVLTALAVNGEYIEEIGEACVNPAGYTQGSIFLARNDVVMHLYKATANITAGQAMTIGTNCELSSLDAMFKKSGQDLDSVKQALSNEVATRAAVGAHNFLPIKASEIKAANTGGQWTGNSFEQYGITYTLTVDSDDNVSAIAVSGTSTGGFSFKIFNDVLMGRKNSLSKGTFILDLGISLVNTNVSFYWNVYNNGSVVKQLVSTTNEKTQFTNDYSDYNQSELGFYIASGKTVPSTTLVPMIVVTSDEYTGFTPYAMTNRELTEDSTLVMEAVTPTADTNITIDSSVNKAYKRNGVVSFKVRFTLTNAISGGDLYKLFTLPFLTSYKPLFPIYNRMPPFTIVSGGCYIETNGGVIAYVDLPAGAYDICGTYLADV